jgi:hypothetical protein
MLTAEKIGRVLVGLNAISIVANVAVAVRTIDKGNAAVIDYNQMREASIAFARIANYQAALINKHLDIEHIDEFDRLVLKDMIKELETRQEEIRKTQGIEPPKDDEKGE